MLAFALAGQAFAVSDGRDNDAALRAMMDDRPHAEAPPMPPVPSPPAQGQPSQGEADGAANEAGAAAQGDAQTQAGEAAPADGQSSEAAAPPVDVSQGDQAAPAPAPAAEAQTPAEGDGGWLSKLFPSVFGNSGSKAPPPEAKPTAAEEAAKEAGAEAAVEHQANPPIPDAGAEHQADAASEPANAPHDGGDAAAQAPGDAPKAETQADAPPVIVEAEKPAASSGGWMSYIPFLGGSSKSEDPKAAQAGHAAKEGEAAHDGEAGKPAAEHGDAQASEEGHNGAAQEASPEGGEHAAAQDHGNTPAGEATHGDAEKSAAEHGEGQANGEDHAGAADGSSSQGDKHATAQSEDHGGASPEGEASHGAQDGEKKSADGASGEAHAEAPKEAASGGGWMSYIPFLGGSSKKPEEAKVEAAQHGEEPKSEEAAKGHGEAKPPKSPADLNGFDAPVEEKAGEGGHDAAKPAAAHGEAAKKEAPSSGGWMSYIPFLGGGKAEPKPAKAEGGHGEPAAEGHGTEGEHGEGAQGEGEPGPPPLWPEEAAVEEARQPYVRVRELRRLQDHVAKGNIAAYDQQKTLTRAIGKEFRELPDEVWADTRNVRAVIYYVLTGGDPQVLPPLLDIKTSPYVSRRLIRAALAYGEGRSVDAKAVLEKIEPEDVDLDLQGLLALIKGTILSKGEPQKAIAYFDKARLYAPGTLVEESALRQQILLVAKSGDMARFDFLSSAYARRFPRSLFARNFRRQIFAGVAKQVFKGEDEWIQRVETEMKRLPPGERAGLYLSIAEEATKGGHIKIAQYAASNAGKLYTPGSRELERARLYEGAVLVATADRDRGVELLSKVQPSILKPTDREIYDAAQFVALNGRPRDVAPRDFGDEQVPPSVTKAEDLLKSTEALLTEESQ